MTREELLRDAELRMRTVRDMLKAAGCRQSLPKARRLLKSIQGAVRHASRPGLPVNQAPVAWAPAPAAS